MYRIFRFRMVGEQLKIDEFPVGTVTFGGGEVTLNIRDRKLNQKLEGLYRQSLWVRRSQGSIHQVVSLTMEKVEPGSKEHFGAFLGTLRSLGLIAVATQG